MEEKKAKRNKFRFVLIVILIAAAAAVYLSGGPDNDKKEIDRIDISELSASENGSSEGPGGGQDDVKMIYVDIGGAVTVPGVVCIPEGSRVFEALEQAGGVSADADTKSLNLASLCTDGEKIYIPTAAETAADPSINASVSAGVSGGGAENAVPKVNINNADSEILQTLSGIGPSTAQKIIDYREQNGRFGSIEELTEVNGIGEKTFQKLKDHITV